MSGKRIAGAGLRLPGFAAVLASLVFHAVACAAIIIVSEITPPPPAPEPEPQPIALMVEFVTDPATSSEKPQEVREGVSDSEAEEDAAPEANEVVDLTQTEQVEEIKPAEPPQPDNIPLPVRRPAPEKRKADEKRPDKTEIAKAKGIEDKPDPDVDTGDTLRRADDANAMLAAQMSRGALRNTPAEQRWQAQLIAHLQRRKRYPSRALSRRKEGIVYVRFTVETDGAVMFPELARSSGVPELDEEVLDLVMRASPVPKPPQGVNSFVTVPVSFQVKG